MIINGIDTKDISVVFQGLVNTKLLQKGIESAKKYLPGAEIIISTYKGTNVSLSGYDTVLFNEDPGCSYDDPNFNRAFNINRWIVSSVNGVKIATRKYVLKCRSDSEIVNVGFLDFWNSYSVREDFFIQAEHKIIIPSLYTLRYLGSRKNDSIIETPFHVSDWYCFGLKSDILDFVSCPLIKNLKRFARYYANKTHLIPYTKMYWCKDWLRKMAPEQYIGLCFAKRKFPEIDIKNVFTFKNFDIEFAEKFLINNFIILDPKQYGVINNKFVSLSNHIYILQDHIWYGIYRNHIYEKNYNRLYKHKLLLPFDIQNNMHKLYNLYSYFLQKKKNIQDKAKLFLYTHKTIWIYVYSFLYITKGFKIYKKVKAFFNNENTLYLCPFRGTGDSYIIANYLKQTGKTTSINFIVPREVNKKILAIFGVYNVYVASETELSLLKKYVKIMHNDKFQIFHYAPDCLYGHIGYNLAGFKNLNFADFYDYLVFREKHPVLYRPINPLCKYRDYKKLYNIKQGKTVLVAPYSDSIPSLDKKEWEFLVIHLQAMGYEVLSNCTDFESALKGTRAVNIQYEEIIPFLEYCGYFISIRSGLCDIVCTAKCRKIILHPKFIHYPYGRYIDFFTLNIPERGLSAEEYEYNEKGNKPVIRKLLKSLE